MRFLSRLAILSVAVQAAACAAKPAIAPIAPTVRQPPAVSVDPPCTGLGCEQFDTPQEAFARVLQSSPSILALGEFHARKGHQGLRTTATRFGEDLLPALQGVASDIVIELWVGGSQCTASRQAVAREQEPVTREHAPSTPNEFVRLGDRAKALGIRPHALEPSCEQLNHILEAGDGAIHEMLVLTAQMFATSARLYFQRNQATGADKMVVTWSGAMHNDLRPNHSCGEPCSFGKQLQTLAGGHYVELDLVVPEYIGDDEFWRKRVWYPYFDRKAVHTRTTLFSPGPGSYVLIFPSTPGWKPR